MNNKSAYKNGSKKNPVDCYEYSEAFECARERNQPVWCFISESIELVKIYPSGSYLKSTQQEYRK